MRRQRLCEACLAGAHEAYKFAGRGRHQCTVPSTAPQSVAPLLAGAGSVACAFFWPVHVVSEETLPSTPCMFAKTAVRAVLGRCLSSRFRQRLELCKPGRANGGCQLFSSFGLLGYMVVSATHAHTELQFGDRALQFCSGAQQGDSSGPLFFAAALEPLVRELQLCVVAHVLLDNQAFMRTSYIAALAP